MFNIINKINESSAVEGFESAVSSVSFGHIVVEHYKTKTSNRFVAFIDSAPVAAISFDSDNYCMFRETLSTHRKQGLNSSLWAYAATQLGTIRHSDNLTEDGKRAAKI